MDELSAADALAARAKKHHRVHRIETIAAWLPTPATMEGMRALLLTFSWQELRHHPWRNAAAVVAVMLGVALAFSVHLI
ncbi:MAG: hypothetical protein EOO29_45505, partial [Comamonadaceae bacterium]